MSSFCVNHPDVEAKASCAECSAAICEQCTETVSSRSLCPKCAETAHAAGVAATTVAAVPSQGNAGGKSPVAGIITAGLIAIAGSVAILELMVYTLSTLSWLFVIVGLVAGLTLRLITGRGGEAMVKTAIVLMLLGIIVSHIAYIDTAMRITGVNTAMSFGDAAPAFLVHLGVIHWIWVLAGIIVAAAATQVAGKGQVAKESPA